MDSFTAALRRPSRPAPAPSTFRPRPLAPMPTPHAVHADTLHAL